MAARLLLNWYADRQIPMEHKYHVIWLLFLVRWCANCNHELQTTGMEEFIISPIIHSNRTISHYMGNPKSSAQCELFSSNGLFSLLNIWSYSHFQFLFVFLYNLTWYWGGEIAQSLASLSVKRAVQVHARLDPLVSERWNSITVLFTHSYQCWWLVKKRPSMCYYVCVIKHVRDP